MILETLRSDETIHLYQIDLALSALSDRFANGRLTEITSGDAAQVTTWRTALYVQPGPSSASCLPIVEAAIPFVEQYERQLTSGDLASIHHNLMQSKHRCTKAATESATASAGGATSS